MRAAGSAELSRDFGSTDGHERIAVERLVKHQFQASLVVLGQRKDGGLEVFERCEGHDGNSFVDGRDAASRSATRAVDRTKAGDVAPVDEARRPVWARESPDRGILDLPALREEFRGASHQNDGASHASFSCSDGRGGGLAAEPWRS